jgi:uncharacterized protein (DUF488 family)
VICILREKPVAATVFTIGYEGTTVSTFVAKLQAARIKVLADVRALSRKKGFSKNSLRAFLQEQGIRYLHFGELGSGAVHSWIFSHGTF